MLESGYFLTVPQVVRAIRRRWFSGLLLSGLILGVAVIVLANIRDSYESQGRFLVKLSSGRATRSLETSAASSTSIMTTPQSEVQSIKQMLTSRNVIEDAIRRVGMDRIVEQRGPLARLSEQLDDYKFWQTETEDAILLGQRVTELERMETCVDYVTAHLGIQADKDGNTIGISARAHTPLLAHDIVDTIMKTFSDHYIDIHRSSDSLEFFASELSKADERVAECEEFDRQLKNQLQLISAESKRALLQNELTTLQSELIMATGNLRSITAKIADLTRSLDQQPANVKAAQTNKANDASNLMRDKLFELELEEGSLLSKYKTDHPQVTQIRESIAKAREAFASQSKTSDESTEAANPVYQRLMIDLLSANAERESLIAKKEIVESEIASAHRKMVQLNEDEILLAESQRRLATALSDHLSYSKKYEEARIQAAMDQNRISDLKEDQPATLIVKKVAPKRALILVAIAFAAGTAGLAFAIYRDQLDYSREIDRVTLATLGNGTHSGHLANRESANKSANATLANHSQSVSKPMLERTLPNQKPARKYSERELSLPKPK